MCGAGLGLSVACSPDRSVSGLVPADAEAAAPASARPGAPGVNNRSVHQFAPTSIYGQPLPLSQYKGRKILIVNTASLCRFTPQYAQLEQLWQQYGSRVVVLGFPCNQFGDQEPGSDSTITSFCTNTFNITFPLFHRISVTGAAADPLYKFLANRTLNGFTNQRPTWNFSKYLVDEQGVLIGYYPPATSPMSPTIISAILR